MEKCLSSDFMGRKIQTFQLLTNSIVTHRIYTQYAIPFSSFLLHFRLSLPTCPLSHFVFLLPYSSFFSEIFFIFHLIFYSFLFPLSFVSCLLSSSPFLFLLFLSFVRCLFSLFPFPPFPSFYFSFPLFLEYFLFFSFRFPLSSNIFPNFSFPSFSLLLSPSLRLFRTSFSFPH